jgi:colicin import membrane protein
MLKEILQNPKAVFWAIMIHILIIVVMLLSFNFSEKDQGISTATPVKIIDSNALIDNPKHPSNTPVVAAIEPETSLPPVLPSTVLPPNNSQANNIIPKIVPSVLKENTPRVATLATQHEAEQKRIQQKQAIEIARQEKEAKARKQAQQKQAAEKQAIEKKRRAEQKRIEATKTAESKKKQEEEAHKRTKIEKAEKIKKQEEARKRADAKKKEAAAQKRAEAKKKEKEAERKRAEAKKKEQEAERKRTETKKAEAEKQKAAERKQAEAEEAKAKKAAAEAAEEKSRETERKQAEAEKAEEAKKQAEEQARAAADKERKAKAAASAANTARINRGKNLWARRVISYMNRCWDRPEQTSGGWSALVNLKISRSLYIRNASIRNCDGSREFCQSIARAIDRCYDRRLPSPPEPEYFDPEINMTFKK